MKDITFHATCNSHSGFGQVVIELFAGLTSRGWNIDVVPFELEETYRGAPCPLPYEFKERIVSKSKNEWELTIGSIECPRLPTPGKRSIYLTMWEQDRINPKQVAILNKAEAVIVPSAWGANVFRKSGVTRPVYAVPLGVNETIFTESPVAETGPCVFGAAGCLGGSWHRKNPWLIANAFLAAFYSGEDVELRIKVLPGEQIAFPDPRIKVTAEMMPWLHLSRWYRGLTAFINVAVEGWGLMPHQAMATGRPVLSPRYGGITEYFDGDNGYPLPFHTLWSAPGDRSYGTLIRVDQRLLSDEMRRVYLDRKEAQEKGMKSAARAHQFTWATAVKRLQEVLNEVI